MLDNQTIELIKIELERFYEEELRKEGLIFNGRDITYNGKIILCVR